MTSFNFTSTHLNENAIFILSKHPTLTSLDVSHNLITDAGLQALVNHPWITDLYLRGCRVNRQKIKILSAAKLRLLDLTDNQINDKGALTLAKNNTLKKLVLTNNFIGDEGAIAFSKHASLEEVILSYNHITDEATTALVNNTQLKTLILNYNQLEGKGGQVLSKSCTLKQLSLAGNHLDDIGVQALGHNSTLTSLDVTFNQIANDGLHGFSWNENLRQLKLDYNQITKDGVKFFHSLSHLEDLSLSYNLIDNEGVEVLSKSKSITRLNLTGNQIGPRGAEAISKNTTLKILLLSCNTIGDDGAISLARSLSIIELWVAYNQIGELGACALAEKQTLEVLNIIYNPITANGRWALLQNKTLKTLFISENDVPEINQKEYHNQLSSQDYFCVRGVDGIIHFLNPAFARVLNYRMDEILARPFREFLHSDDRNLEIQNELPLQEINRYRNKDGSYRWIRWTLQAKQGNIYTFGADITIQKQTEERLRLVQEENIQMQARTHSAKKYSKQQADFIAQLCHELRNPLTGVSSNIELLQEELATLKNQLHKEYGELSTSVNQHFTEIKQSLADMSICTTYQENILNENLDVAKISENKLVLDQKPINLKILLTEVAKIFKAKAEKKGLKFNLILPETEIMLKGDALRIKQIIVNLVSNAIKFTTQGEINMKLKLLEQKASSTRFEIQVQDTGIGLEAEEVNKLFQRFSQSQASVGGQYGGSGLGLFIAKRLANLMQGDITLTSQKGIGTTFFCQIECKNLIPERQITENKQPMEENKLLPQASFIMFPQARLEKKEEEKKRALC
jgi:PAS domain S-box-containing protein